MSWNVFSLKGGYLLFCCHWNCSTCVQFYKKSYPDKSIKLINQLMWWRNLKKSLLKTKAGLETMVKPEMWQWFSTHYYITAPHNTKSGLNKLIMNIVSKVSLSTTEGCLSSSLLTPGLRSRRQNDTILIFTTLKSIWTALPKFIRHIYSISSVRLPSFYVHCNDTIKVSYCSSWVL